jgi:hypothetical protein
MSKIILKNKKNIIIMHVNIKHYLKNYLKTPARQIR